MSLILLVQCCIRLKTINVLFTHDFDFFIQMIQLFCRSGPDQLDKTHFRTCHSRKSTRIDGANVSKGLLHLSLVISVEILTLPGNVTVIVARFVRQF
jgi:hypothetical protein